MTDKKHTSASAVFSLQGKSERSELKSSDAEFLATLFGGMIMIALIGSIVLLCAGGWTWFAAFLQGQASGWAQAFGGIAAIAGAYRMGRSQIDADRELESSRARDKDARIVVAVAAIFEDVTYHVDVLWKQVFIEKSDFVVMTEFHAERIAECAKRISNIDPFILPLPELVKAISLTPSSLMHLYDDLVKYQKLLHESEYENLEHQSRILANCLSVARINLVSVADTCRKVLERSAF